MNDTLSKLTSLSIPLARQLQSVLNATARLTHHLHWSDHITDAFVCLCWLRGLTCLAVDLYILLTPTIWQRLCSSWQLSPTSPWTWNAGRGRTTCQMTWRALVDDCNLVVDDTRRLCSAASLTCTVPSTRIIRSCRPTSLQQFASCTASRRRLWTLQSATKDTLVWLIETAAPSDFLLLGIVY